MGNKKHIVGVSRKTFEKIELYKRIFEIKYGVKITTGSIIDKLVNENLNVEMSEKDE